MQDITRFYHGISIHAPHEGERRLLCGLGLCAQLFQSTLPTRGSDDFQPHAVHSQGISIHAPHEGERLSPVIRSKASLLISIHAPHEGERLKAMFGQGCTVYISIHAPHEGERRGASKARILTKWAFQSTLPTRGSDIPRRKTARWCSLHFNPRSPRGGATFCAQSAFRPTCHISIHAPHEGERRGGLVL